MKKSNPKSKGYSFIPSAKLLKSHYYPTKQELAELDKKIEIERRWHSSSKAFQDESEIISDTTLVKVEPTDNYLPIMRFRNPDLHDKYPPYLLPAAKKLLDEVAERWRAAADQAGIDREVRLSVTSLVRSVAYQKQITAAGKISAQTGSSHSYGEAFDIDAHGYYMGELAINTIPKEGHEPYREGFADLGIDTVPPPVGDGNLFNREVFVILEKVLEKMQAEGKLHYIHEIPGTPSSAFHICRAPSYS